MANQIPEDISISDVALLAPLMVATATSHQSVLDQYMMPALDESWLTKLQDQVLSLQDAIDVLAKEELETRELSLAVKAIVAKLPAWRYHILTLAELAYAEHPKRLKFMRDLGRGKSLASQSIGPVRRYLQEVVPEVRAHRAALLAAGGYAETIDRGGEWAEQLSDLKIEVARERAEDNQAITVALSARDTLVRTLRILIMAANAAEWHHAETERAIANALEEGYRKIRKRTTAEAAPTKADENGLRETLPPNAETPVEATPAEATPAEATPA